MNPQACLIAFDDIMDPGGGWREMMGWWGDDAHFLINEANPDSSSFQGLICSYKLDPS
jgi:hypothetical protein